MLFCARLVLCSDGAGRGTCTCTCETKPASSSSSKESSATSGIVHPVKPVEQYVPETAALMRTAARPREDSAAAKAKPQPHHQSQNQAGTQNAAAGGGNGIVHVPPIQTYNAYQPVVNDEPQQQQQQQQVETAEQNEYVNYHTCCTFRYRLLY